MPDATDLGRRAALRRLRSRAGRSYPVGDKSRAALAAAGDPDGAVSSGIAFPKGTALVNRSAHRLLDLAGEARHAE